MRKFGHRDMTAINIIMYNTYIYIIVLRGEGERNKLSREHADFTVVYNKRKRCRVSATIILVINIIIRIVMPLLLSFGIAVSLVAIVFYR